MKPSKRVQVIVFVSISVMFVLALILGPLYLQHKGTTMAMTATNRLFALAKSGGLKSAQAEHLIDRDAASRLMGAGDKSGVFSSFQANVKACQASGAPCIVSVTVYQERRPLKFDLWFYWGFCAFANSEP